MARNFTAASSQSLEVASSPVSGPPFTLAAWARPTGTGSSTYVAVGELGGTHRYLLQQGFGGTNNVGASVTTPALAFGASTSTGVAAGTWHHAAAVFTSNVSRTAYINGGNSATNTSSLTLNTPTSVVIGARYNTTLGFYFGGDIAEVGIWNAALTADEIASLAKGMSCDKVRPQSLVFYAPLVRDLIDQKGGRIITNNNGATVANHPRVYA